jgi:Spy/CpxP family protein refolding chaperone
MWAFSFNLLFRASSRELVAMKSYLFVLGAVALLGTTQLAFGQPGRGGPGGGGGGFGGSVTDLLRDDKVKAELNIVPDQEKQLEEVASKIRDSARDFFGGLRDLSDDERRAKFDEFRANATKEVEAVLLPQQRERLKQLMVQSSARFSRSPGGINDTLATELGITDAQKEALRKKAEEVQADLDKKLTKLRDEARTEILSVLTSDQRSKLEKMMGPKFEFSPPQFGGGGPGGNRGGPQGQGGRPGGAAPLRRPADGD